MFPKALQTLVALFFGAVASADPIELYIDADYSISAAAAHAIELGVRTALEETGGQLAGQDVKIVPLDHRGNAKRTLGTIKRYLESDRALAIIGGIHSPNYLTNKGFINRNGVLTLIPWAAAGPITRTEPGEPNWVFRLSVDDSHSGGFLVEAATQGGGCKRVALLLLDSGWGHANLGNLTAALRARDMSPVAVEFFALTIGAASAGTLAQKVAQSKADCAIMLASWDNGATLTLALAERNPELQIFSHWGIVAGGFTDRVPHRVREQMQIRVLQTCGLRREKEANPILRDALRRAAPDAESLTNVPAPSGFVHGYDLTKILVAAAEQAAASPQWQGDIVSRRHAVHKALQNLQTPVDGILERYAAPFAAFSADDPDAHEALGLEDLCMTRFREDGRLEDAG